MNSNSMRDVPEEEVPVLNEKTPDGGVPVLEEEAADGSIPVLNEETPDRGVPALEGIAPNNGNVAVEIENGGKKETQTLPDGYFWLEAIRKKRMNKGRAEYFIKWLGWPESDNTWEPYEHLGAEVVEAFEKRIQSGKAKSGEKAKPGQKAKPWQKRRTPRILVKEPSLIPDKRDGGLDNGVDDNMGERNTSQEPDQTNGRVLIPPQVEGGGGEQNERDVKGGETINVLNMGNMDVHMQGVGEADVNGQARDGEELAQAGLRNASRKRKPVKITRFREKDTDRRINPSDNGNGRARDGMDLAQTSLSNASEKIKHVLVTRLHEEETDRRMNCSHNGNQDDPAIVKIIRHVSTEVSDKQNDGLIVTFAALRSDGKEVRVENGYLKIVCPQLLFRFYEECMYTPKASDKEAADKEAEDKEDAHKEDVDKEASDS